MKKALYIHHSNSLGGGGESYIEMAKIMSRKFDLTLIIPYAKGEFYEKISGEIDKDVKVMGFGKEIDTIPCYSGANIGPIRAFRAFTKFRKDMTQWAGIINSGQFDVVFVNSIVLSWFSLLSFESPVKRYCFVREGKKNGFTWGLAGYQKKLLERFDLVYFLSRYDLKRFNISTEKSYVLRDTISDRSLLECINQKDQKDQKVNKCILFLGGSARIKGLEVLLKALPFLSDIKLDIIVAGNMGNKGFSFSGLYCSYIHHLIRNTGENININVSLIGYSKNIEVIFKKADVIVFPSIAPHQARPVFEAGKYSRGVIISDYPNTKEAVKDTYNGLVFDPGNSSDLALKIRMICEDELLCHYLGVNNYNHYLENHLPCVVEKMFLDSLNFSDR